MCPIRPERPARYDKVVGAVRGVDIAIAVCRFHIFRSICLLVIFDLVKFDIEADLRSTTILSSFLLRERCSPFLVLLLLSGPFQLIRNQETHVILSLATLTIKDFAYLPLIIAVLHFL